MSELLPPGYYDAVCIKKADDQGVMAFARLDGTKSGDPQVTADFKILNPPDGYPSQSIRWFGSFKEKAARRTVESLRLMGFRGNDFLQLDGQELDQIVSVLVEHNEWQGKVNARIAFINPPGGAPVKLSNPLSIDAKRQFAAMMMSKLDKVPEVAGERYTGSTDAPAAPTATKNAVAQEQPPPMMDDDIPF